MPLRHYWAETQPNVAFQDLTANAGLTEHVYSYSTTVPTSAHIVKLVCSGGISIRGDCFADIVNLGLPMTWSHNIVMIEGSSDAWPSGRIVTLNKQAGALVTSQVSQPQQLVDFSEHTKVINSRVVTTYSADIHPIDQKMSYGSVSQSIGARQFYASFYVHGRHTPAGGYDPPDYKYSASFVLRVLYEREVAGGGGGG